MLKYYDEALNAFVMELSCICAKIVRPSTNYINAALISAYRSPESSGITFDSEDKLVNYKWALVCIALEIAKTKKHDAMLREVGVKRSLQAYKFDQLSSMLLLDIIGVMQSSLISDKSKNSIFADLYESQAFADFYLFAACSNYESLRQFLFRGIESNNERFTVNLLHADLTVFNLLDERTRNEYSSIDNILQERKTYSEQFLLGEGSVDNLVTKNFKKAGTVVEGISKHTLKQMISLIYMSYDWSEKTLLLSIRDKNEEKMTFAPYLATEEYVSTPFDERNINHFKHALSMEFVSKIPNNDERFSYVRVLARCSPENANNFKDVFNDLTIDNAKLCPWLAQLVANVANVPLFTKIMKKLAESGVPYEMHTLEGVDCYVEPEAKYQIFSDLVNIITSNKSDKIASLDNYLAYAFSYIKCYATAMNDSDPELTNCSDDVDPELLQKYAKSVGDFAKSIKQRMEREQYDNCSYSMAISKVEDLAKESHALNVGNYIKTRIVHEENKQVIGNYCTEVVVDSVAIDPDPTILY